MLRRHLGMGGSGAGIQGLQATQGSPATASVNIETRSGNSSEVLKSEIINDFNFGKLAYDATLVS